MAGINLAALAEGDFDLGSLEMALPVSNEKNKQLEGEVKRREREIAALQVQIDEHRDRAQALRDHLRNVRQELGHTQVGAWQWRDGNYPLFRPPTPSLHLSIPLFLPYFSLLTFHKGPLSFS